MKNILKSVFISQVRRTLWHFIALAALISALPASAVSAAEAAGASQAPKTESPQAADSAAPDLQKMLGAMLMLGFRGASLGEKDPFLEKVRAGKLGGVILFDKDVSSGKSRNIESPEQLKRLCGQLKSAAPGYLFIAADQEGGQVRRLKPQKGFMDLASAQAMGQGSMHDTYSTAEKLGEEMRDLGLNVDLAPVADVDSNPFNPAIGRLGRSFNSDPLLASQHALAFGQGLAKSGVIPVLKHFPGQGCAGKDSHIEAMDVSQCWKADVDLLPYAEILKAGWPGMIMVGHISHQGLDTSLPASLSKNIIDGLLRQGLDWRGVVISDDLQMKAVSQGRDLKETIFLAVEAGNDILLFGNNLEWDESLPDKVWQALNELVAENRLSESRIRESWQRISALREAYSKAPALPAPKPEGQPEPQPESQAPAAN